jgi:hypothetical protein
MRVRPPSLILAFALAIASEARAEGDQSSFIERSRARPINVAIEVAPITVARSINRGIAGTFLLSELVVYFPRLRYGTAYVGGGYGPIVAQPAYFVGRAGVELDPMGKDRAGVLLLVGGRYVRLYGRMPEPYRTETLDQGIAYGPLGELGVGALLPGKHNTPTVRLTGIGFFGPLTYDSTDATTGARAVHREPSFGGEVAISVNVF